MAIKVLFIVLMFEMLSTFDHHKQPLNTNIHARAEYMKKLVFFNAEDSRIKDLKYLNKIKDKRKVINNV